MVTADVLAVVFFLLGLFVAIPAFQLVIRALWPRFEAQSRRRFEQTPIRTVLLGGLIFVPMVGAALGLLQIDNGAVRMMGVWGLGGAMALSLMGLSGLGSHVGSTIPGPGDADRPWWPMAKGMVALELACLIPVFGWFLLFPLLCVAGAGAAALAVIKPLRQPPAPEAVSLSQVRNSA